MPVIGLPKQTERSFMGQVTKLADLLRWRWWHDVTINAPRACPKCHTPLTFPRSKPGFPDLLMLRGDTLWVVELKSDRNAVTDDQQDWLTAFMAVKRVKVGVWRPKGFEKVVSALR